MVFDGTTNRQAYGEALVALGQNDERVVVLEADLGKSTMTFLFGKRFPDRYFPMGIAEQNMMGAAAGLAAAGFIPYASTFCIFASMRASEQVRNSIAYPNLGVRIVATNAGVEIGADGATHQAIEDLAIMRAIPNMTVVAPSDPIMTTWVIHHSANFPGPVYIRLGRQIAPIIHSLETEFKFGKAVQLTPGSDVTLVAVGNMVSRALDASGQLAKEGISARVLDMFTVKPIDSEALVRAAWETGCLVSVEDHNILGGLGGAVAEALCASHPVPLERVGMSDQFGRSGDWEELLDYYGLNAAAIVQAARRALARKHASPVLMAQGVSYEGYS